MECIDDAEMLLCVNCARVGCRFTAYICCKDATKLPAVAGPCSYPLYSAAAGGAHVGTLGFAQKRSALVSVPCWSTESAAFLADLDARLLPQAWHQPCRLPTFTPGFL